MKKLLTLSALIGLTLSSYGQGLVSINSTFIFTTNSTSVGGTSGNMVSGTTSPNAYYFALLTIQDPTGSTTLPVVSSASSLTSGWFESGITGTNASGIRAGQLSGILATPGAVASSWAAGTTNFTVVVGWSSVLGSTWSAIASQIQSGNYVNTTAAAVLGWSAVGYGASTSLAPAFTVFGAGAGQINSGFVMNAVAPVPEPSTLVLAGLGGLSLLAFRRKK